MLLPGCVANVIERVVFDTGVVLSALTHKNGRLAWLKPHWQNGNCLPLICRETALELARILTYPKFGLTAPVQQDMLAEYLPYCEHVEIRTKSSIHCRDKNDQIFLNLAHSAKADALVSGDQDLLALAGQTEFAIESPEQYRQRFHA